MCVPCTGPGEDKTTDHPRQGPPGARAAIQRRQAGWHRGVQTTLLGRARPSQPENMPLGLTSVLCFPSLRGPLLRACLLGKHPPQPLCSEVRECVSLGESHTRDSVGAPQSVLWRPGGKMPARPWGVQLLLGTGLVVTCTRTAEGPRGLVELSPATCPTPFGVLPGPGGGAEHGEWEGGGVSMGGRTGTSSGTADSGLVG